MTRATTAQPMAQYQKWAGLATKAQCALSYSCAFVAFGRCPAVRHTVHSCALYGAEPGALSRWDSSSAFLVSVMYRAAGLSWSTPMIQRCVRRSSVAMLKMTPDTYSQV